MRFLTLNIGASKATIAEYSLSGKRKLTLTAYGSGDLSAIDANDPAALSAALPPVLHEILRTVPVVADLQWKYLAVLDQMDEPLEHVPVVDKLVP